MQTKYKHVEKEDNKLTFRANVCNVCKIPLFARDDRVSCIQCQSLPLITSITITLNGAKFFLNVDVLIFQIKLLVYFSFAHLVLFYVVISLQQLIVVCCALFYLGAVYKGRPANGEGVVL